jgi:hypothetical protein
VSVTGNSVPAPEPAEWQEDLDHYHELCRAARVTTEEYLSGRYDAKSSEDFEPQSVHFRYHENLNIKWTAGSAFFRKWGFYPGEPERRGDQHGDSPNL